MSLQPIEPGDLVEYVTIHAGGLVSPGEIVTGRGRVADVIRGEAGNAELIISVPADNPIGGFRIDVRLVGYRYQTVRPLGAQG